MVKRSNDTGEPLEYHINTVLGIPLAVPKSEFFFYHTIERLTKQEIITFADFLAAERTMVFYGYKWIDKEKE